MWKLWYLHFEFGISSTGAHTRRALWRRVESCLASSLSEFRITKEKKGKLNGQENFTTLIYAGKPDEMMEAEGLTLRQTGIPFRGGGVVILLIASCHGHLNKLRMDGWHEVRTDFTFNLPHSCTSKSWVNWKCISVCLVLLLLKNR